MQALAAVQAQAQLQRQMLAQQQALLASVPTVAPPAAALVAAAAAGGATLASGPAVDSTTARKSREVYIGNLSIGSVTPEMLTELFNAALVGMVPDPIREPPVINVKMDATGGSTVCCGVSFQVLRPSLYLLGKHGQPGKVLSACGPRPTPQHPRQILHGRWSPSAWS
jgi:hypothetical protein